MDIVANILKKRLPDYTPSRERPDHSSWDSTKSIAEITNKILDDARAKQRERDHIQAKARAKQKERERFKDRLDGAINFNHNLGLNTKAKSVAVELFTSLNFRQEGYKLEQKLKDFEILLANLLNKKKCPIVVSLDRSDWVDTEYLRRSYYTVKLIHKLYNQNFLNMKIGYHTECQSRLTRILATEKLLDYFPEFHTMVISKPINLVELRELNSNKLVGYKETKFTYRIKKILAKANEVNGAAIIRYQEFKLNCNLIAIFKGKFSLYGRLHTSGFKHYQGFNRHERDVITINGDQAIELDYSGLHPMLLYANEGIQYQTDPYQVIENDCMVRSFLKHIFLFMINTDFNTAQKAANYWLYNRSDEERGALTSIGITRARPLMEKFLEIHAPIAHYLCQGKQTGLKLFNKDALIALDIVAYFTRKDIPVLCIHDSFIVQEQHENELRKVMLQIYAKHTKTTDKPKGFLCGIKRAL